jgi:ribosomal protein S18 acetylase RimI-like enzyme
MSWYKIAQQNDEIRIDNATDEWGEVDYELSNQSDQLARDVDLGITRDRELYNVVKDMNGNVIASLWISFDGDNYEFDVAVSKEHQGKGIGTALINTGIEEFEQGQYPDINPNATMKLHVTSEISKGALERRGFSVIENLSNGEYIMERL